MRDYPDLTPENALIFRITHRGNVPWILENGLHCASSNLRDPKFIAIGKPDLIQRRERRRIDAPPGGTLADYVPFYFAPRTPMLGNVRFGRGVQQRANEEIVFVISSLHLLREHGVEFLFTDRHAATRYTRFSSSLSDLAWLPWEDFQARRFKKDLDKLDRFEQYQAEALAFRYVPVGALRGIACYARNVKARLEEAITERGLEVKTYVRTSWYIP